VGKIMGFLYIKKYFPYFDDPDLIKKSIDNFNEWIDKNGIIRKHYNPQWVKLHCRFDHYKFGNITPPPGNDHAELYRDKDGNRVYIYQPYKNGSWNEKAVMEWAEKRGLLAEILPPEKSWHYPGETYLIVLRIVDEKMFIKYVESNMFKNIKWGGEWDVC